MLITFTQLFSLLCVLFVFGFLLGLLERKSAGYFVQGFGGRGYLPTSYIGTPVHELGHVVMCWLFRHRVGKVQWFPKRGNGTVLGYVEHSYSKSSLYQRIGNFFVGIGPMISGILALIGLMYIFVPDSYEGFMDHIDTGVQPGAVSMEMLRGVLQSSSVLFRGLFSMQNLLAPSFWLFLFLALSISSHMALSMPDIKGAASGVVTIFSGLFTVNLIGYVLNIDMNQYVAVLAGYNAYLVAFASLAVLFSLIHFAICFLLFLVKKKGLFQGNHLKL
ncbi:hypothetical protein [Mesobacillus foraminis]|uniref:hypothetical protein n=1 Tax=Mesobacillus foraminis TaxID=279826 RepID=UPI001F540DFC|nr:hypothetical protein [Mesobacillus foraminis]